MSIIVKDGQYSDFRVGTPGWNLKLVVEVDGRLYRMSGPGTHGWSFDGPHELYRDLVRVAQDHISFDSFAKEVAFPDPHALHVAGACAKLGWYARNLLWRKDQDLIIRAQGMVKKGRFEKAAELLRQTNEGGQPIGFVEEEFCQNGKKKK